MSLLAPPAQVYKRFFGRFVDGVEFWVSCFALWSLVVVLTVSMVYRYLLGYSIPWAEEVSRFSFVLVVFASMSYAARRERHIRLYMFIDLLPSAVKRWVITVADLMWLAFNVCIIAAGIAVVRQMLVYQDHSVVLNLPMYYLYAVIPLFYATMTFRVAQAMRRRLRKQ